jgi:tetratricopeptide (TPR) repeat protein
MAVDKALAIRPEDRPQTISEFRNLIKSQQVSGSAAFKPSSAARTAQTIEPELPQKTLADPSFSEEKASMEGVVDESIQSKKKYLFMVFLGVLALGIGWLVLMSNSKKQVAHKNDSTLSVESKEATVKVMPIAVEASQSVVQEPVKSSPLVVMPKEEKKVAPSPKPTLSFVEIDSAIDAGQLAIAQSLLKDVIRNNPDSAAAYFRLGQIFAKEDKYPEAREQLNKAKRIDPSLLFTAPGKYQELYNEILAMEKMSKLPGRN